jgi:hypothetical protein
VWWAASSSPGRSRYDANTDKVLDGAQARTVRPASPFGTLVARLAGKREFPVTRQG